MMHKAKQGNCMHWLQEHAHTQKKNMTSNVQHLLWQTNRSTRTQLHRS